MTNLVGRVAKAIAARMEELDILYKMEGGEWYDQDKQQLARAALDAIGIDEIIRMLGSFVDAYHGRLTSVSDEILDRAEELYKDLGGK